MPPITLRILCAVIAVILAVIVLVGSDAARQIVFLAVMGIVLAVGLVVP